MCPFNQYHSDTDESFIVTFIKFEYLLTLNKNSFSSTEQRPKPPRNHHFSSQGLSLKSTYLSFACIFGLQIQRPPVCACRETAFQGTNSSLPKQSLLSESPINLDPTNLEIKSSHSQHMWFIWKRIF